MNTQLSFREIIQSSKAISYYQSTVFIFFANYRHSFLLRTEETLIVLLQLF